MLAFRGKLIRTPTERYPVCVAKMDKATQKVFAALLAIGLALYGKGYISTGSAAAGDSIDGLTFPGQLKGQTLVGGGTRAKYGAVKVYAVGLYIDASRAASSLKPFVGLPAAKLPANFFKVLQSGKFDRTLLLQFHRAVAAETVAGDDEGDAAAAPLSVAVAPAGIFFVYMKTECPPGHVGVSNTSLHFLHHCAMTST